MPRISRFKLKDSDRSGFKFFEITLVKDGPYKVSAEEYDTPPPSRRPLGGEGEVSGDPRDNSSFVTFSTSVATPTDLDNPTVSITSSGGIVPSFAHPWMRITGSNAAVDITADPQIAAGQEGQILTLQCVDSGVTLDHGTGLNLMGSAQFVMRSGSFITFYYSTGGTVWNEASRTQ